MRAAAHAPAQLMQLRQPELLGVLDHHHRRVGHVHAHLDDRGREQHTDAVGAEVIHHRLLLPRVHPAVQQPDAMGREGLLQLREFFRHRLDARLRVRHFEARINDVGLPSFLQLAADELMHLGQLLVAAQEGADLAAQRGQLIDDRGIQIAVERQPERARNGRGRHDEQVRVTALAQQLFALGHAKLVLLVDDDEAEFRHVKAGGEQRVGADEELRAGGGGRGGPALNSQL